MKCKYREEEKLLYTYEEDIHPLQRSIEAFETGNTISPSLNWEHFLFILDKFKIDLNGKKVLNLGCGHGILDLLIAKNYDCNITSIEFSKNRIDRCNYLKKEYNINNVTFIHEDINIYLNELKSKYDIVMAFEVIEHLYSQSEVLKKCKENTKGVFFGTVPIQPNCKQKQHISFFKSISHASSILDCSIFLQDVIPLRLPECVLFYNKIG